MLWNTDKIPTRGYRYIRAWVSGNWENFGSCTEPVLQVPQNTTIIGIINLKLDKGCTHPKIIAKKEQAIGIIGCQIRATGLIGT